MVVEIYTLLGPCSKLRWATSDVIIIDSSLLASDNWQIELSKKFLIIAHDFQLIENILEVVDKNLLISLCILLARAFVPQ